MTTEKHSGKPAAEAGKKGYHHGDLRQVLIDEAAKMIREHGEAALSMRKLAARAGVSRTAPYHHFEDKQDLLCAVAEEGFRRFDAFVDRQPVFTDLRQHLLYHMRAYVSFATENPEYYDLMFSSSIWTSKQISATLKERAYGTFRKYSENMMRLCDELALPEGVVPLRVAQLSWSTFHGLSRLMIDGIYMDNTALEAIFDTTAKLLVPDDTVN